MLLHIPRLESMGALEKTIFQKEMALLGAFLGKLVYPHESRTSLSH